MLAFFMQFENFVILWYYVIIQIMYRGLKWLLLNLKNIKLVKKNGLIDYIKFC